MDIETFEQVDLEKTMAINIDAINKKLTEEELEKTKDLDLSIIIEEYYINE